MDRISLKHLGLAACAASVLVCLSGCEEGTIGSRSVARLVPQVKGYVANEQARVNTLTTTVDRYVQEERKGGKDVLKQFDGYVRNESESCNTFRQTLRRWGENQ